MPERVTFVKTSERAESRLRKGVREYRMRCSRCGAVRWFPMGGLGTYHCLLGTFLFALARPNKPCRVAPG